MVNPRFPKAVESLYQEIIQLYKNLTAQDMQWLLRGSLVNSRQREAGFVLPTTALLLVVVALVTTALVARTSNRTNQVIGERQGKVITNAASPAIDRAKAKLEYLFNGDNRLPNGVPGQRRLAELMGDNRYNLPDQNPTRAEQRLDLDDDDQRDDNAWSYRADTDANPQTGDANGNDATIAYSIIAQAPADQNELSDQREATIDARARNLLVRNGPVNSAQTTSNECRQRQQNFAAQPEDGWFVSNTNAAQLRKNFQINAFVIPDNQQSRTVTTLELQQDRQLDRGNKWGAWFRTDIELIRPPVFNWNGAMHTEGSIFVGENDDFTAFLISSPSSCVYNRTATEITSSETINEQNQIQFQGQIVNGSIALNQMQSNTIGFHFLNQNNQPVSNDTTFTQKTSNTAQITSSTDSISSTFSGTPSDLALNPVRIFTEDRSEANGVTNWSNVRDPNWNGRDLVSNRRTYNQRQPKPYIDDTYRADNRYGPKPTYSRDITRTIPGRIGTPINASNPPGNPLTVNDLISNNPLTNNEENLGLDGYWERRARREGLRVIVGQRLELSDRLPFDPSNPLRPLNPPASGTSHQARQRRALRDNLAAVQATAIYHQANRDGGDVRDLPVACLATTAHPGTATTITNSTTFNNISINGTNRLNTDFFTGNGTNGWEFNPPANVATEAGFANAIAAGQPLRIALTNLAFFAGDYQDTNNDGVPERSGAFPPTQEVSGSTIVHPHSTLTQWGNFSELRRVIGLLDGTAYNDLSIADQSTLHTASCLLGMLAYNLDNLQTYSYTSNQAALNTLNTALAGISLSAGSLPETYIAALPAVNRPVAQLINVKEQVQRDRRFGFASVPNGTYQYTITRNTTPFAFGGINYISTATANTPQKTLNLGCDFSNGTGNNYFGFGAPINALDEQKFIRLAVSLCPTQPKYPSLYYLFPVANHPHDDDTAPATNPRNQPDERYILDTYIRDAGINGSRTYQALSTANITNMALQPRLPASWKLPNLTVTNLTTRPNTITERVTNSAVNTFRAIPFLDKGIFNGREMIAVRVLDFDLDLLRRNTLTIDPDPIDDNWLPQLGVVYAFREDAVREDGIARPAGATMNAGTVTGTNPQDPTITSANGITTKPVDFLPDPDRRPYGFRLKNGADLTREPLAKDHENNLRGLSLVSDNPVYVQGNFNLHSTNGTTSNSLEEFTEALNTTNYTNFYTRSTQDLRFANPSQDRWRPSEIIADAVTILSNNFCDGSIEDSFTTPGTTGSTSQVPTATFALYGCNNTDRRTSYTNQNRPSTSISDWRRENPFNSGSPIVVNENGSPVRIGTPNNAYSGSYYTFDVNNKPLITPTETRVNAIIVSGTVPSRARQINGGLHNFPRFLESWTGTTLRIAGALIQLNFSTYATAPFDQDVWEPGETVTNRDDRWYYLAPNRRWGYDVALQMSPAGPVSRRFVTPSDTRSEFYRELPADDPYIRNLRCARDGQDNRIDPSATCP